MLSLVTEKKKKLLGEEYTNRIRGHSLKDASSMEERIYRKYKWYAVGKEKRRLSFYLLLSFFSLPSPHYLFASAYYSPLPPTRLGWRSYRECVGLLYWLPFPHSKEIKQRMNTPHYLATHTIQVRIEIQSLCALSEDTLPLVWGLSHNHTSPRNALWAEWMLENGFAFAHGSWDNSFVLEVGRACQPCGLHASHSLPLRWRCKRSCGFPHGMRIGLVPAVGLGEVRC